MQHDSCRNRLDIHCPSSSGTWEFEGRIGGISLRSLGYFTGIAATWLLTAAGLADPLPANKFYNFETLKTVLCILGMTCSIVAWLHWLISYWIAYSYKPIHTSPAWALRVSPCALYLTYLLELQSIYEVFDNINAWRCKSVPFGTTLTSVMCIQNSRLVQIEYISLLGALKEPACAKQAHEAIYKHPWSLCHLQIIGKFASCSALEALQLVEYIT